LLSAALLECLAAGWWPKAFEGRGPVLVLAAAVLFLAGIFAMGSWARSLALRIPDDKLASRTRIVTWCVVVAVPLDQFATAALDTIGRGEPPWMENTLIGIGVVSRITAVIFGLIALVLMAFYVQRLLDAARVAANRRGTLPVTGDGNEDGARVTAAGR
jgi:hypothetical protein